MLAEMIEVRLIDQTMSPATIKLITIQRAVAGHFGVRVEEMWSERRARAVSRPRMIAMFLAKGLTGYSLPRIGRHFGNRDHTTVMHACRVVPLLCEKFPEIRDAVRELRALLTKYEDPEELRRARVELGLELAAESSGGGAGMTSSRISASPIAAESIPPARRARNAFGQRVCLCGTANHDLRKRCRDCGAELVADDDKEESGE